jgi:hypothetical protein
VSVAERRLKIRRSLAVYAPKEVASQISENISHLALLVVT